MLIADFLLQTNYNNAQSVDKNFFTESSLAAHSKGRASMPGSDHTGGVESNFRGSTSTLNDEVKPWKKHNKKNKSKDLKEKDKKENKKEKKGKKEEKKEEMKEEKNEKE